MNGAKAIAIIPIKRTKTVRTEAQRIRFLLLCTRFFIIDFLKIFSLFIIIQNKLIYLIKRIRELFLLAIFVVLSQSFLPLDSQILQFHQD